MNMKSARLGLALVATAAILGAGGCAGTTPAAQPPQVASIVQPSAGASASALAERPRHRLDETEADYKALIAPLLKCMREHGVTTEKEATNWDSGNNWSKAHRTAQKACERFFPLPAWEQDPANPEAKDFTQKEIKCLRAKGVKYVEAEEDGITIAFGGPQNDAESITKGMEFSSVCERAARAEK